MTPLYFNIPSSYQARSQSYPPMHHPRITQSPHGIICYVWWIIRYFVCLSKWAQWSYTSKLPPNFSWKTINMTLLLLGLVTLLWFFNQYTTHPNAGEICKIIRNQPPWRWPTILSPKYANTPWQLHCCYDQLTRIRPVVWLQTLWMEPTIFQPNYPPIVSYH